MYTNYEIMENENRVVFKNEVFLHKKMALKMVAVMNEIWLFKSELSILLSILTLWRF